MKNSHSAAAEEKKKPSPETSQYCSEQHSSIQAMHLLCDMPVQV